MDFFKIFLTVFLAIFLFFCFKIEHVILRAVCVIINTSLLITGIMIILQDFA